jgi:hypothetical protein
MNKSFGPWTTAINTGAKQDLNTFWKRRLAMLPTLSQCSSRATRRAVVILAILAIGALALPTLKRGTQAQTLTHAIQSEVPAVQSADAGKPALAAERPEERTNESRVRSAAPVVEYFPRPTKAEARMLEALSMPIDFDFRARPLEECLDFIKNSPNLPTFELLLDRVTLADEGVATDGPITLKLKGCRLESALKLLLDPLQLTCVFENDVLMVTTAPKAGEKLFTRIYPVRDLYEGRERAVRRDVAEKSDRPQGGGFGRGMKYDDLVEAILINLEPESWEELSGPGTLTYVKESGSLVIRQTLQVHREILQLLRDLREAKKMGQVPRDRGAS